MTSSTVARLVSGGCIALALIVALCSMTGCREGDGERVVGAATLGSRGSETVDGPRRQPRPEMAAAMREAAAAPRHASDGAGQAQLTSGGDAIVGSPGSWSFRFEAGPEGVAEGGTIDFQVSPFWGWSTPQVLHDQSPGFTRVESEAVVEPATIDEQLLRITVGEGGLGPGGVVTIDYGVGDAGAHADRFAEAASRFWFAVDGDGDGVRGVVRDSPAVRVRPGSPAHIEWIGPSTARPGEVVRYHLSVLDARGNAGVTWEGEAEVIWPEDWEGPRTVHLGPEEHGTAVVDVRVGDSGIERPRARVDAFVAEANPLQISGGSRVLWGDLQSHSGWSDGTGEPQELFRFARDVAALDVYALTDHDHWGFLFLDENPDLWEEIKASVHATHDPGRFVALLGFEWTNWVHGHRHVLWFDEPGPDHRVISSIDPVTDTPQGLWAALAEAGQDAITVAHHPAGGPISTDWSIPPDPRFEPVVEIVSVHGSSEAMDAPKLIHRPVPGNFVRDALAKGYRLGFVGSSDGHDGHPGLARLASPSGGIVAILAEEKTRPAIAEALRSRRTWATNGPRILVRASFGGHPVGSTVPVGPDGPEGQAGSPIPRDTVIVRVVAPGALDRIELISRDVVGGVACEGKRECSFDGRLTEPQPGEWLYVRVLQEDGGAAWTSPWFFVDREEGSGE